MPKIGNWLANICKARLPRSLLRTHLQLHTDSNCTHTHIRNRHTTHTQRRGLWLSVEFISYFLSVSNFPVSQFPGFMLQRWKDGQYGFVGVGVQD